MLAEPVEVDIITLPVDTLVRWTQHDGWRSVTFVGRKSLSVDATSMAGVKIVTEWGTPLATLYRHARVEVVGAPRDETWGQR